MADEIKYLSLEGLRHFWQDKLKPEIEYDEEVIAASLVDLDDRLKSHSHNYVASAGYVATAANAVTAGRAIYSASAAYSGSAGYIATAARAVTSGRAIYSASAGYSGSAGYISTAARAVTAGRAIYSASAAYSGSAGYSASAAKATYAASAGYSGSAGYVACTGSVSYALKIAGISYNGSEAKEITINTFGAASTTHTHAYVASAGYSASAAKATSSASAGYSASAARATYAASAGYVARVHLNSGDSSMWYPMVFTNTKTPTTGAQLYMDSHTDTTSTATGIRYNPSTNRCYCSGGFYEASDERLKNFGNDIEVDLDKLLKLSKKYFTWKDDKSNTQHIGISAQELQELYPEIVNVIDEDGHLSVSYDKLSVVALKGIDVLNDKITSLEKRLDKLEGKLNIAQ